MSVSQKCQYALRAVFEMARRHGEGPTSIREIARAQKAPCLLELSTTYAFDQLRG